MGKSNRSGVSNAGQAQRVVDRRPGVDLELTGRHADIRIGGDLHVAGHTRDVTVPVDLRRSDPTSWVERVINTHDAASTATALTIEHGQVVIRGAGSGTGTKSNRRSAFLIPRSPGGYSRIRSRWGGRAESGTLLPQRGHLHGLGYQADGKIRGVAVWHDSLFGIGNLFNLGIWEGDPAAPATAIVLPTIRILDRADVSAGARASNVVTLTVPAGHGFVAGDVVTVDMSDNTYDGTFVLATATATTVTYPQVASDDASAGTGTIALARQSTTKTALARQVAVSDAVRASGVVTATVPAGHPFQVGDSVLADLTDATYDGSFRITATTATTIVWRQPADDDASAGSGTVEKLFPYWVESEWTPGMVRARVWPDVGVAAGTGGPLPAGPPPWESAWAVTVDLTPAGASQPDPARGDGCALIAAHLASGSTVTEMRYDSIETTPIGA